ncbi:MAG: hypothetical protein V4590_13170 [Bacteroidota bacterium]
MLTAKEYPSNLDKNPFLIKDSKFSNLLRGIACLTIGTACFYSLVTDNYLKNGFLFLFLTPLIIFAGIYFCYHFVYPQVIAKLDDQGLWTKKHGLIDWNNLEYYYTRQNINKGTWTMFYYKIKHSEKEFNFDLSRSDFNNENTIRRYITIFKGDNEIEDKGTE